MGNVLSNYQNYPYLNISKKKVMIISYLKKQMNKEETIIFGGGCFWCTETVFSKLKGVSEVTSGYAGGTMQSPTYQKVSQGNTGHAEVIKLVFNKKIIPLSVLLEIFFTIHDPTTLNQQGNDIGKQYRSIILCTTKEQKQEIEIFIKKEQKQFKSKITTQVLPIKDFYTAEQYHQKFYQKNPSNSYCSLVISPKIKKLNEKFKAYLK